jgi:cobalt-zinc-cadmium efflux system outer membrane protein
MTHPLLKSIFFTFTLLSGCALEHEPLPALSLYKNTTKFSETDSVLPDTAAIINNDITQTSYETQVTPKEFTLDQAIQTALKTDPRISAALENVRQAEADLTTAGLIPNPDLSTGGSLMPLDRKFTVDRQGGPPQFDVGVAMPVDWFLFGKRAAAITSGEYGVDAASADFANTIRLRIAATIGAFYDVLEAQAMLRLAQENQKKT